MRRDRILLLLVWGLVALFCAPSLWAQCSAVTSDGTAVANQVSKFTTACNIEPSAITETGGKVGIGTAAPAATLDVKGTATIRGTVQLPSTGTATATKAFSSQPLDALSSAFNSGTGKAVSQHFRWQAEVFNNDTSSPIGTMNLLYASGTAAPAETGFLVSNGGSVLASELDVIAAGQQVFHVGQSGSVGASGNANFGGGVFSVGELGIAAVPGGKYFFFVDSGGIHMSPPGGGNGIFTVDTSGQLSAAGGAPSTAMDSFPLDWIFSQAAVKGFSASIILAMLLRRWAWVHSRLDSFLVT